MGLGLQPGCSRLHGRHVTNRAIFSSPHLTLPPLGKHSHTPRSADKPCFRKCSWCEVPTRLPWAGNCRGCGCSQHTALGTSSTQTFVRDGHNPRKIEDAQRPRNETAKRLAGVCPESRVWGQLRWKSERKIEGEKKKPLLRAKGLKGQAKAFLV